MLESIFLLGQLPESTLDLLSRFPSLLVELRLLFLHFVTQSLHVAAHLLEVHTITHMSALEKGKEDIPYHVKSIHIVSQHFDWCKCFKMKIIAKPIYSESVVESILKINFHDFSA